MRERPGSLEGKSTATRSRIAYLLVLLCPSQSSLAAPRQDEAFEQVRREVKERTGSTLRWRPAPSKPVTEASLQTPVSEKMTLEDVLQVAALRNPSLQATYQELGIARGDLIQAGLLENPSLQAQWRFPDDDTDDDLGDNTELIITQNVLDFSLRKFRRRVAAAEYEQARFRVGAEVLELLFEVKSAFFELQGAQKMLSRQESVLELAEAAAELSQRQRDVGNISPLDLAVHQAAYQQARIDIIRLQADVIKARESLARLMGLTGTTHEWSVAGEFPDLPSDNPELDVLEAMALSRRLDLAAARIQVVIFERQLDLTRASIIPAVNLGVSTERDPEGIRVTGPTLALDLPLFDRKQGTRHRQRSEIERSRQQVKELEQRILADVRIGFNRLVTARHVAESYRAALLPLQGEIVNQSQLQYNFMLVGVYELLQARQNQIRAHRDSIQALTDYWMARASLERSLGTQLSVASTLSASEVDSPRSSAQSHSKRLSGGGH